MRNSINAIVNVVRNGIRRNRVAEALVARGVDALRASGPADCMHCHAPHAGPARLEQPQGGLLVLLDSRSSLDASTAWRSLPIAAGKRKSSQLFAGSYFTTCTATTERPQAAGRFEQRTGRVAVRLPASA